MGHLPLNFRERDAPKWIPVGVVKAVARLRGGGTPVLNDVRGVFPLSNFESCREALELSLSICLQPWALSASLVPGELLASASRGLQSFLMAQLLQQFAVSMLAAGKAAEAEEFIGGMHVLVFQGKGEVYRVSA